MRRDGRWATSILVACCLLGAAGCGDRGERSYAIPQELCGVEVNGAHVLPLLPNGKELTEVGDLFAGNHTRCKVIVDDVQVVTVLFSRVDQFYDPMAEIEAYRFTGRKPVKGWPLEGAAAMGSRNVMVSAECGAPKAPWFIVDISVGTGVTPDEAQRRADMRKFAESYTRGLHKALGCPTTA